MGLAVKDGLGDGVIDDVALGEGVVEGGMGVLVNVEVDVGGFVAVGELVAEGMAVGMAISPQKAAPIPLKPSNITTANNKTTLPIVKPKMVNGRKPSTTRLIALSKDANARWMVKITKPSGHR